MPNLCYTWLDGKLNLFHWHTHKEKQEVIEYNYHRSSAPVVSLWPQTWMKASAKYNVCVFATKRNPELQCVVFSLATAPSTMSLKDIIMCYTTWAA